MTVSFVRGRPTVSVAICAFNASRFIDETLASVFAQTFDDYEVVIVDDGSTDGGVDAIARRYADPRLKIVRQSHQGLSLARRASIANSSGEFVAFLDSDDLWMPAKLERQVSDARAHPSAALLFSDCLYIDENGRTLKRLSDDYDLSDLDLSGPRGYSELLRRGCFVWQSTVLARTDALRAVHAFNPDYPYIADYDTWLRMARRYELHYTPAVLAKWRVHPTQFTNRCPEITLADHRTLLGSLFRTESIPRPLRISMGDRLLGQHRVSFRHLMRQKRFGLAARAALGMLSYPDRFVAFGLGALAETRVIGPPLLFAYKALRQRLRGEARPSNENAAPAAPAHVWIDGSALGMAQTGYFSLVSELIRALARGQACVVHVVASPAGQDALRRRLGADADGLTFHAPGWRRFARPRGRPSHPNTIEVIVWRGSFRWKHSRRVAIVQDLTTRILPETHTARTIADFEEFIAYAHRHAELVATISEHSRRDIIEQLAFFPASVSTIPIPINPCYVDPALDPSIPSAHRIIGPYLLSVGSLEPRKNLRRLARAFEQLANHEAFRDHVLVLAGPSGWDDGFEQFLEQSPAAARIRRLGFVPVEHMPSLYHFASAVVCASLYEGFGLPVLEGMSASGVVIASGTSSLREVLGDGITFDPGSTEAIASALLQVVTMTPVEQAAYRRRGRAQAEALMARAAWMPLLPGLPAGDERRA